MKKFLFCFIPTSLTHCPEMSIPSLTAQLRHNNYDVSVLDLNIDFFHQMFNKEYLENAVVKAQKQFKPDFQIIEIGGTIGDIEGLPFIESIRQFKAEAGIAKWTS